MAHPSGELRVDLPSDFNWATDAPGFKAHWSARGFEVLGVRLDQGHAVVRPVTSGILCCMDGIGRFAARSSGPWRTALRV